MTKWPEDFESVQESKDITTSVTDDRQAFEAYWRSKENFKESFLAVDGRYPDYYGNPVVQGSWEGYQAALRSHGKVADALTVTITAEAWNFLIGIGSMDGKYFGEPDEKGHAFWWRHKLLPTAIIGEGD